MIIVTLRMGLGGKEVLTLNDSGVWESKSRPTLAEMLNLDFETSPAQRYSPGLGYALAYYVEVAHRVAEKYHAEIEVAPLPPPSQISADMIT